MATKNSKSNTTAKRIGRPTNAERAVRAQSAAENLVNIAAAAFSSGLRQGLGLPADDNGSTVTTIASASGLASGSTSSAAPAVAASKPAKAPSAKKTTNGGTAGRPTNPNSKMSKTRQLYADNLKAANPLSRAELVKAAAKAIGYTEQTGNTYISTIDKENGRQLVRRGSATA